jgi:hypothetical protein
MQPASLAHVVLPLSCPASLAPSAHPHHLGAACCLSHSASAGQGKARHDKASAAPARIIGRKQRDAEFHVAGCRRTVGCGLEAPGGVGSCRDDWKSLRELGGPLPSPRPSRSGSCWVCVYLPAPPLPPGTPVLTPREVVKEGGGVRACVKR